MQNEIPQDIFSSTQFGEAYKQNRSPLKWKLQRAFGPSGAIRTLGPVNPNHVRYQLRYTRIFSFSAWYHARKKKASFSCLWVALWSSPVLRGDLQAGDFRRKLLSQGLPEFRFWGNGWVVYPPKAGALPTALHPDNLIFVYGVSALQIKTVTVS